MSSSGAPAARPCFSRPTHEAAGLDRARRRVACPGPRGGRATSPARLVSRLLGRARLPPRAGDHSARAGRGLVSPERYRSGRPDLAGHSFERYVRRIEALPDAQPRPRPGRWPGAPRLPRGGAAEGRRAVAPSCSTMPTTPVTRRRSRPCAQGPLRGLAGNGAHGTGPGVGGRRLVHHDLAAAALNRSERRRGMSGARCTAPMAISEVTLDQDEMVGVREQLEQSVSSKRRR